MATDGPTPPDCAAEIYERGTLMFQTASIGGSNAIERWVQKIAATSAQPVDWHFAGVRVMVLALGDLSRVRAAIREHMPEHDAMYCAAALKSDAETAQFISNHTPLDPTTLHPYRPAWWGDDVAQEPDTAPRVIADSNGRMVIHDPQAAAIIAAVTGR